MIMAHKKLRARMIERDMDLAGLARVIVKGRTTASARLNGKEPWGLDEVYAICDELEIPYADIPAYFPPVEKQSAQKKRRAC